MIKAIIVDDEAPARRELRRLLAAHDTIDVTGEASTVAAARGLLLRARPDAIFLDIHMGRESGFDLLRDVDADTAIVFVTAFDTHAIEAFDASALDYLLKPVDPARLAESVSRLVSFAGRQARGADTGATKASFTPLSWVFFDDETRPEFVEIATITHLVAEGGATRVHTTDGRSRPSPRSLTEWLDRLPPTDFKRVHRSAVVNMRHVARIEHWSNYSYRVHLVGGREPVVMSRRYSSALRGELS